MLGLPLSDDGAYVDWPVRVSKHKQEDSGVDTDDYHASPELCRGCLGRRLLRSGWLLEANISTSADEGIKY